MWINTVIVRKHLHLIVFCGAGIDGNTLKSLSSFEISYVEHTVICRRENGIFTYQAAGMVEAQVKNRSRVQDEVARHNRPSGSSTHFSLPTAECA